MIDSSYLSFRIASLYSLFLLNTFKASKIFNRPPPISNDLPYIIGLSQYLAEINNEHSRDDCSLEMLALYHWFNFYY